MFVYVQYGLNCNLLVQTFVYQQFSVSYDISFFSLNISLITVAFSKIHLCC